MGPAERPALESFLSNALQRVPDAYGGLVVTLDGRVAAAHVVRSGWSAERLGAITATILSVARTGAQELGGQRCDEVQISFEKGLLVLSRVGDERHGLCLIAGGRCPLGIAVSASRQLREELLRHLSGIVK